MLQHLINGLIYIRHPFLIREVRRHTGRLPNIAMPLSAAEKFLWRKMFDRNPLFQMICDKLAAKNYAAQRCPEVLIPEVLWAGKSFNAVPTDLLNGPAVLKTNHASGQVIFLHRKEADRTALEATVVQWLSKPYGQRNGEWGYRNIDRRLFVEKFICGQDGKPLEDFNVYVFGGTARYTQCLRNSYGPNPTTTRYDRNGNEMEAHTRSPFVCESVDAPAQYPQIIAAAERLGAGFDHMRCDFYLCDGKIYFCEMTVYPIAGFPLEAGAYGAIWRQAWDVRRSWFLTTPQTGWRGWYASWLRAQLDTDPA